MTERGQLEATLALYWAFIGTVASINYLTGWHALEDGLGITGSGLTAIYLVWFLTVIRGVPEQLEVAFR